MGKWGSPDAFGEKVWRVERLQSGNERSDLNNGLLTMSNRALHG